MIQFYSHWFSFAHIESVLLTLIQLYSHCFSLTNFDSVLLVLDSVLLVLIQFYSFWFSFTHIDSVLLTLIQFYSLWVSFIHFDSVLLTLIPKEHNVKHCKHAQVFLSYMMKNWKENLPLYILSDKRNAIIEGYWIFANYVCMDRPMIRICCQYELALFTVCILWISRAKQCYVTVKKKSKKPWSRGHCAACAK